MDASNLSNHSRSTIGGLVFSLIMRTDGQGIGNLGCCPTQLGNSPGPPSSWAIDSNIVIVDF